MRLIFINFVLFSSLAFTQEIFTEYLAEGQDTIDVFSYQIPEFYNNESSHPLLVAFHHILFLRP